MYEPLYKVKIDCALCNTIFETSRVRPSYKKTKEIDSDFCRHYDRVNPNYYMVRVCPECGYASTENFSPVLFPAHRERFLQEYCSKWTKKDYGGERTWQSALETYKLALVCAKMKEEPLRIIANLLHHIAWMYRYGNDTVEEKKYLRFTLDAYREMYETESGEVDEARLMYLIGELNRRLGHWNEAVRWFSRVVGDKSIMNSHIIQLSREQWMKTREEMAGQ